MRTATIAIVLIAVAAGAGGIHANSLSAGSADGDLFAMRPAVKERALLDPTAAAQPKAHDKKATRLAQLRPLVPPAEATSGDPSLAPLKWVGLLVLPDPKNQPNGILECTAQFITASVLLTAGHCLKDLQTVPTGPWPDVTKGIFWLQYQAGEGTPFKLSCGLANPLYTLPSNYSSLTTAQQNAAQMAAWNHDFAMILVNGTSPTGVMPYALDWQGKVSTVTRVGYAADILNGAIVQQASGPVFFADNLPVLSQLFPHEIVQWGPVTDLTGGTSGGAWIANFSTTEGANNNILVAVTSAQLLAFPGGEDAAYLTAAEFNPLLTSVSNGCK